MKRHPLDHHIAVFVSGTYRIYITGNPITSSLGSRPIDIHLKAVEKMGVEIAESSKGIYCKVRNLQGTKIKLSFPSVGATENIMLLGTLAKGVTIIENPAKEPEIVDLQLFLNKAGGNICGAGTNRIYIEGVKKLDWCEHTIIPDRIETGTFMHRLCTFYK